jgi:hypothetical protein
MSGTAAALVMKAVQDRAAAWNEMTTRETTGLGTAIARDMATARNGTTGLDMTTALEMAAALDMTTALETGTALEMATA